MRNHDKHPIDNYFEKYMEQDFPYKASSWKKASKVIDAYYGYKKKKLVVLFSFLVFLICGGIYAIVNPNDSSTKRVSKPSKSYQKRPEKAVIQSSNSIHTSDSSNSNSTQKHSILTSTPTIKYSNHREGPNSASEIATSSSPSIKLENKQPDELTPETHSTYNNTITDLTPFLINSKPFTGAEHQLNNKEPQILDTKIREPKKIKLHLEFETQYAIMAKQTFNGISSNFSDYKNTYEEVKNMKFYRFNFIIQKNKIALITGLGHQNVSIKTNYSIDQVFYETNITYKTENKFIPSKSGNYLMITTRQDTLSKKVETFKISNQLSQNNFQYILIPLKLFYQYNYKRLKLSLRTGADFSYLYDVKGSYINADLNAVSELTGKEIKRLNTNFSIQLNSGYQLNHKFQIGGNLFYSKQLGSNFTSYKHQFENSGLGFYVRMGL